MFKFEENEDVWLISDSHAFHKNLCLGSTSWRDKNGKVPVSKVRNFENQYLMTEKMIENINSVVKQEDTIIHLGDVSFGGLESVSKFLDRLICKNIHLVFGNHDKNIISNRSNLRRYFLSTQHYLEFYYGTQKFVAMHYPITSWNGLRKGVIHVHGHCHLPNNKKISGGKRIDVGLDGHPDFKPYHVKDVINIMKKINISSELGENDHHNED